MIFELINPSDAVTFIGDDITVAGVAIMVLGRGRYGLTDDKGEVVVPLMLFGGSEYWLAEHGVDDLDAWLTANYLRVAEFLETCAYGSRLEREAFDQAIARMTPEHAEAHREWWNDRNRSSMNNIGQAAAAYAKTLRKKAEAVA